ncbi:unnamed protein product, partial [Mycena citricolor]
RVPFPELYKQNDTAWAEIAEVRTMEHGPDIVATRVTLPGDVLSATSPPRRVEDAVCQPLGNTDHVARGQSKTGIRRDIHEEEDEDEPLTDDELLSEDTTEKGDQPEPTVATCVAPMGAELCAAAPARGVLAAETLERPHTDQTPEGVTPEVPIPQNTHAREKETRSVEELPTAVRVAAPGDALSAI